MRFNCEYDVVVEMKFPLGESTDLVYDTWANQVLQSAAARFPARVTRSGDTLQLSRRVYVWSHTDIGNAVSAMVGAVGAQAPGDVTVKLHDTRVFPKPVECETIPMEEVL